MKPYAKKFYKSSAWIKCRESYFNMQHGICERCGEAGHIVHHKEYITPSNINEPNITLNWDNLELLCQECHNKEHMTKQTNIREGLKFNSKGELVKC